MPFDISGARCIDERYKNNKRSAIRITAPIFSYPEWIPFWAVHDNSEVWKDGTSGKLLIKEKFAEEKGWL